MTNVLDRIKAYKLEEVAVAKARLPLHALEAAAHDAPAPRGFASALMEQSRTGYGLIAEIKKASRHEGSSGPTSIRRNLRAHSRRAAQPAFRF